MIKVLNSAITCAEDPELEFVSYENTTVLKYPPHDLHLFDEKFILKFDFFIFNQTIEHLYNPFKAFNIYKYMKSGGYVFTSVPTINIPHMTPIHYNGYNPVGLALLFMSCGFEVIEIGQWGNYDYIQKLFKYIGGLMQHRYLLILAKKFKLTSVHLYQDQSNLLFYEIAKFFLIIHP